MPKIFISYRRDDSPYEADKLHRLLTQHVDSAKDIFIDVDNIPIGVDYVEYLEQQVSQCDVLLALIGRSWLDIRDKTTGDRRLDDPNDFVRIEIRSALKRGIPVAPVLFDNTPPPPEEKLPDDLKPLARRNGAEVRRLSFDADVARLVQKLGLARSSRSAPKQLIQTSSRPQINVELSRTFQSLTQDDIELRQRFSVEGFEHSPFIMVSDRDAATWAVAHLDERGRRSFVNMGDHQFSDKSCVTVEQLAISTTTMRFNSTLADRCELIRREFGPGAFHADFEDVKRAADFIGPVNVVNFIDLRKIRNPEIAAIDGVAHWNQGPFVTYRNQVDVEGRAFFISSHDGSAVNDWFVVETIANHVIDLGRWYDNRPALVRISNSFILHELIVPEPPYKSAVLVDIETAFDPASEL